jgi:pyruvate/2-oxoglutarate dehydrogenase complex dihydrolipoamide acyltransferase (E2) component
MTERKPPGVSFETWIEKQIRDAGERGAFDNLPGAGKPLPNLDAPQDDEWWVKDFIRREGIPTEELLPTPLKLRREIELLRGTVARFRREQQVRDHVEDLNVQIKDWIRFGTGPFVPVAPVDVEKVVEQWQADRAARLEAKAAEAAAARAAIEEAAAARAPWWRRLTRRKSGH